MRSVLIASVLALSACGGDPPSCGPGNPQICRIAPGADCRTIDGCCACETSGTDVVVSFAVPVGEVSIRPVTDNYAVYDVSVEAAGEEQVRVRWKLRGEVIAAQSMAGSWWTVEAH